MRAVIQRVTRAVVRVESKTVGEIGPGLLVLVGIATTDTAEAATALAEKVATLRIFPDAEGKMNRSVVEAGGAVLAVSQFTLFGDVRKGRRPSFIAAAPPEVAEPLYEKFLTALRGFSSGPSGDLSGHALRVESGVFRAMMEVELVNDGPVTILIDTDRDF
jgi:D-aminoacyl-tRNA deacylase